MSVFVNCRAIHHAACSASGSNQSSRRGAWSEGVRASPCADGRRCGRTCGDGDYSLTQRTRGQLTYGRYEDSGLRQWWPLAGAPKLIII
eukprot:2884211-Prymnesium_polylepis.3